MGWEAVFEGFRAQDWNVVVPCKDISHHLHLLRKIALKLRRRLPPSVEIDDLISDGFIGLARAERRFDPSRGIPFPYFACRAIEGAMLDGLRQRDWVPRQIRDRPAPAPVIHSLVGEPVDSSNFDEKTRQRESLAAALVPLSRKARLVLQLYYLEELTMPQIARIMDVTVSRISQLRSRSIRRIVANDHLTAASARTRKEEGVEAAQKT